MNEISSSLLWYGTTVVEVSTERETESSTSLKSCDAERECKSEVTSVVLDFIQQLGDMFIKLGQYTKPLLLTNIYF